MIMNAFDFHNIVNAHGIAISLTGMAIVFSGLLLISISLWSLPRVLALFEKSDKQPATDTSQSKPSSPSQTTTVEADSGDTDIAGIIGLVLQLEDQRRLASARPAIQSIPN